MNSSNRSCGIAVALIALAFSGFAAGAGDTYYRWTDASGTPVNSDRPPPAGVEYDIVTTRSNTMVDTRVAETDMPVAVNTNSGNNTGQQSAPAPRMVIEKNPEACTVAQQNLETLNTHARIRMPNADGDLRFLNEDEKASQREQAQAAIAQNCE